MVAVAVRVTSLAVLTALAWPPSPGPAHPAPLSGAAAGPAAPVDGPRPRATLSYRLDTRAGLVVVLRTRSEWVQVRYRVPATGADTGTDPGSVAVHRTVRVHAGRIRLALPSGTSRLRVRALAYPGHRTGLWVGIPVPVRNAVTGSTPHGSHVGGPPTAHHGRG